LSRSARNRPESDGSDWDRDAPETIIAKVLSGLPGIGRDRWMKVRIPLGLFQSALFHLAFLLIKLEQVQNQVQTLFRTVVDDTLARWLA
jgi:hypothetical protein